MQENSDPRLEDQTKLEEIRRAVDDVEHDPPTLAKIALEAMIRDHYSDLTVSALSAARVAMRSGNVSQLTAVAMISSAGAERLRPIFKLTKCNTGGAQRVSTPPN